MKLKREDFLGALRRVAPLCKSRTTLPILSHVHMEAMNGNLRITASDGDAFVSASCNCSGGLDACCVPPNPLLALASYGPDTMEITKAETRLNIVAGSRGRLETLDVKEFPKWPSDNLTELGVVPLDLFDAIALVHWACDPRSLKGVSAQSVWVNMDTKKSIIQSLSMDGKRLGMFQRSAIVPNCSLLIPCDYATLLCEALAGDKVSVKYNDSWLSVQGDYFRCAVCQMKGYEPPVKEFRKQIESAQDVGIIPLLDMMRDLEAMRSVAGIDPFVKGMATFTKEGIVLEYVGKNSDFHSLVPLAGLTAGTQSKALQCLPNSSTANDVAGESVEPETAQTQIRFDAALLHNVLKHTGPTLAKCKIATGTVVFEAGDVTTALGLLRGEYK